MMAEFTIGELPWMYLKENMKNSKTSARDIFRDKTLDMKETYDHTLLLKKLPHEFNLFLEHLQSLTFEERPNYALLLGMLNYIHWRHTLIWVGVQGGGYFWYIYTHKLST